MVEPTGSPVQAMVEPFFKPMSDAERQRLFRQRRKVRDQDMAALLLALWEVCPDEHRAGFAADPASAAVLCAARALAGPGVVEKISPPQKVRNNG